MSVGVMTVRVMTVRVMSVGEITVGVMTRSNDCRSNETTPLEQGLLGVVVGSHMIFYILFVSIVI